LASHLAVKDVLALQASLEAVQTYNCSWVTVFSTASDFQHSCLATDVFSSSNSDVNCFGSNCRAATSMCMCLNGAQMVPSLLSRRTVTRCNAGSEPNDVCQRQLRSAGLVGTCASSLLLSVRLRPSHPRFGVHYLSCTLSIYIFCL